MLIKTIRFVGKVTIYSLVCIRFFYKGNCIENGHFTRVLRIQTKRNALTKG